MSAHLLPNEILISIIPLLPNRELKTFRLCNRLLCIEAEVHLFSRVTVRYLRYDFERLEALANHQRLRLLVRAIDYVGDRFPSDMNIELWRHHYSRNRHVQLNSLVWLRHPYREYQKISNEQKRLDHDDSAFDLWAMAFAAFANLKEIRLLMREYQKPNNGKLQSVVRRTFCEPDKDVNEFVGPASIEVASAGLFHLASMLRPSHRPISLLHGARIQTLHLENVSLCPQRDIDVERMRLSSLKNLAVSFAFDQRDVAIWDFEGNWWLRRLLLAATNLTRLRVSYEPNFDYFIPITFIEPCPKLEFVELSHVSIDLLELTDLIMHHREKLQELKIEGADIFGWKSWQVLTKSLEVVPYLEHFHDSDFEGLQSPEDNINQDTTQPEESLASRIKKLKDVLNGAMVSYSEVQQTFTAKWNTADGDTTQRWSH